MFWQHFFSITIAKAKLKPEYLVPAKCSDRITTFKTGATHQRISAKKCFSSKLDKVVN